MILFFQEPFTLITVKGAYTCHFFKQISLVASARRKFSSSCQVGHRFEKRLLLGYSKIIISLHEAHRDTHQHCVEVERIEVAFSLSHRICRYRSLSYVEAR